VQFYIFIHQWRFSNTSTINFNHRRNHPFSTRKSEIDSHYFHGKQMKKNNLHDVVKECETRNNENSEWTTSQTASQLHTEQKCQIRANLYFLSTEWKDVMSGMIEHYSEFRNIGMDQLNRHYYRG